MQADWVTGALLLLSAIAITVLARVALVLSHKEHLSVNFSGFGVTVSIDSKTRKHTKEPSNEESEVVQE